MEKMKTCFFVAFWACVLAFASACSKAPDDVAIKVMKCLRDGDGDAVKANCTSQEARNLKTGRKQLEKAWAGASFKVVETDTYGDEATVTVEIIQNDGTPETAEIELKKDDGVWKVSLGAWPPGTVLAIVSEAGFDGNTDAIEANCTETGAEWFKGMAQNITRPPNYSSKVLETSIHGTEAEVTVEETYDGENGTETYTGQFNLKKVGGVWKVHAIKDDE